MYAVRSCTPFNLHQNFEIIYHLNLLFLFYMKPNLQY